MSISVNENRINQNNDNIAFNSKHGNKHGSLFSSDEDRQKQEEVSLDYNAFISLYGTIHNLYKNKK